MRKNYKNKIQTGNITPVIPVCHRVTQLSIYKYLLFVKQKLYYPDYSVQGG
jgi:hypothetical protein